MKSEIIFFTIAIILFGNLHSASAIENTVYSKNGFSIEYPENWEVFDNWKQYQKEVFFQVDLRSNSGITIKHQKSITSISTINDELLQFMIDNERQNCRINKGGPCWNFEFTSAKTTVLDSSTIILLEYQATLDDKETVIKKIFIPDDDKNWLITIKVTKDKIELLDDIEKSIKTFSRHNEMTQEVKMLELTSKKIPEWVKNTMKWYVEGQITEKEMISVLEFLIEQEIIKVNFAQ